VPRVIMPVYCSTSLECGLVEDAVGISVLHFMDDFTAACMKYFFVL
jgi:hypothetical protein